MLKPNERQIESISKATEKFINTLPVKVMDLYSRNVGSEIIGPVQGRPVTEDLQILVDQECDNLFKSMRRSQPYPVVTFEIAFVVVLKNNNCQLP